MMVKSTIIFSIAIGAMVHAYLCAAFFVATHIKHYIINESNK